MSGIDAWKEKYRKWWVGKKIRMEDGTIREIVDVWLTGPPSFVYGNVTIVLDNGDRILIPSPLGTYKPRKKDLWLFFDVVEED